MAERPRGRARRGRAAEQEEPEIPLSFRDRGTLGNLAIVLAVLGLVGGSGALAWRAIQPSAPAGLPGCHPARQVAPRTYVQAPPMCIDTSRTYVADITTTHGKLQITMPPGEAPATVNNFVVLATSGFYNGLAFWRVESWIVQAGDPLGNGRGGSGYFLPDEPSRGQWGAGAVGMARIPGGPVSGSQFFILKDVWPGAGPPAGQTYNRFGTLTNGLDVLGTLTAQDRIVSISIRVE